MILKIFTIFFAAFGIWNFGIDAVIVIGEIASCYSDLRIQYDGTAKHYCEDLWTNVGNDIIIRLFN